MNSSEVEPNPDIICNDFHSDQEDSENPTRTLFEAQIVRSEKDPFIYTLSTNFPDGVMKPIQSARATSPADASLVAAHNRLMDVAEETHELSLNNW